MTKSSMTSRARWQRQLKVWSLNVRRNTVIWFRPLERFGPSNGLWQRISKIEMSLATMWTRVGCVFRFSLSVRENSSSGMSIFSLITTIRMRTSWPMWDNSIKKNLTWFPMKYWFHRILTKKPSRPWWIPRFSNPNVEKKSNWSI